VPTRSVRRRVRVRARARVRVRVQGAAYGAYPVRLGEVRVRVRVRSDPNPNPSPNPNPEQGRTTWPPPYLSPCISPISHLYLAHISRAGPYDVAATLLHNAALGLLGGI